MQTVTKALTDARKLISKPENWTKKTLARDNAGKNCLLLSKDAVCYCSVGALHKSAVNDRIIANAMQILRGFTPNNRPVVHYNDHTTTTHEDILAMFDLAIEKSKQE